MSVTAAAGMEDIVELNSATTEAAAALQMTRTCLNLPPYWNCKGTCPYTSAQPELSL